MTCLADIRRGTPGKDTAMKICADVGGSYIDLALVSDDGRLLARSRYPTPESWEAFVAVFRAACKQYSGAAGEGIPLSIATAGLVDSETGFVRAVNVSYLDGRELAAGLRVALDREITLVNDAQAFVLAEAHLGVARGHRHVFGIILGTGVGGALCLDGRILAGPGGVSGEWGHGPVLHARPGAVPQSAPVFRCACGRRGCLNTVGGARGLEKLHHFLHGTEATSREITAAWLAGESSAAATIDYHATLLAGPIAMILNTFPATIVPVGGGLANVPQLVALLDARVRAGLLRATGAPVVVPAALGGDAGLLGAALAVR